MTTVKKTLIALPVAALLATTGCTNMSSSQQSTLSAGAIGAAAGAGITALAGGDAIWGALGGAAVGALGGFLYNKHEESQNQKQN